MRIKNSWVSIAVLSIGIVLIGLWGVKTFIERPQDLGTELEYIGKKTYGCYLHWVCSSDPITSYYFGTDLTQDELKTYFKKAEYAEHPNLLGGGGGDYSYDYLFFKPVNGAEEFSIDYYDNTQVVIDLKDLRQTGKQNVISLTVEDFLAAQSAL